MKKEEVIKEIHALSTKIGGSNKHASAILCFLNASLVNSKEEELCKLVQEFSNKHNR